MSTTQRSALVLLTFAMSVFVVSFPLMVIALRDFGPATATLVRMLAGGAVLALAARGSFGRLRGYGCPPRQPPPGATPFGNRPINRSIWRPRQDSNL